MAGLDLLQGWHHAACLNVPRGPWELWHECRCTFLSAEKGRAAEVSGLGAEKAVITDVNMIVRKTEGVRVGITLTSS